MSGSVMNRAISLIFILSVFVCLSSCRGENSFSFSETGGKEADKNTIHFMAQFAESETTLYYMENMQCQSNDRLIFTDKASGYTGVLCGKPECMHDDDSCGAKLSGDRLYGLQLYEGKLYWISVSAVDGICVWRCKCDGTDRQMVRKLGEYNEPGYPTASETVVFHRGYVFIAGDRTIVEDGEEWTDEFVLAFSLQGNEEPVEIFHERSAVSTFVQIRPEDDRIYYAFYKGYDDEESPYGISVHYWDIGQKVSETVYEGKCPFSFYEYWVSDDKILFTSQTDGNVYTLDTASGKWEQFYDSGDDLSFMSANIVENRIIGYFFHNEENSRTVKVMDFSGKMLLDSEETTDEYETGGHIFLGADEDSLYYSIFNFDKSLEYIIAVSLQDGKTRQIWQCRDLYERIEQDEKETSGTDHAMCASLHDGIYFRQKCAG